MAVKARAIAGPSQWAPAAIHTTAPPAAGKRIACRALPSAMAGLNPPCLPGAKATLAAWDTRATGTAGRRTVGRPPASRPVCPGLLVLRRPRVLPPPGRNPRAGKGRGMPENMTPCPILTSPLRPRDPPARQLSCPARKRRSGARKERRSGARKEQRIRATRRPLPPRQAGRAQRRTETVTAGKAGRRTRPQAAGKPRRRTETAPGGRRTETMAAGAAQQRAHPEAAGRTGRQTETARAGKARPQIPQATAGGAQRPGHPGAAGRPRRRTEAAAAGRGRRAACRRPAPAHPWTLHRRARPRYPQRPVVP